MSLRYKACRYIWDRPWFKAEYGKSLYKHICRLGEAPNAPFEADFFGLRYAGNLTNTIDFSVFYYGAFEKPLLFFLRDCMRSLYQWPLTFCDVGANIGQHALFMSRIAESVHAFEPFEPVRQRLISQIELNRIDNLFVHPVGLSDVAEKLPFYAPTGRNQGIGSFDASTIEKGNQKIGDLALVNGDEFFSAQGITNIGLIKIDVEGFEKSVLMGLAQTLQSERPVVVCELTYNRELSINSIDELKALFPARYEFLAFDTRKADGSKARRRGARARYTGDYRLIPFQFDSPQGQDNIVACPGELAARLPLSNSRKG